MAGNGPKDIDKIGIIQTRFPAGSPAERVSFSGNLFQSDLLRMRAEFPSGNIPVATLFRTLRSDVRNELSATISQALGKDHLSGRELSALIVKIEPERIYSAGDIGDLLIIANRQESNEPITRSGAIVNGVILRPIQLDAVDLLLGLVVDQEKPRLADELLKLGVTSIPEMAITRLLASIPEKALGAQYNAREVAVFLYGIVSSTPIMEGEPVYDYRAIELRIVASKNPENTSLFDRKVMSFLSNRFGIKPETVEYASIVLKEEGYTIDQPRLFGLLLRGILEVTSNRPYSRTPVELSGMVPDLVKLGLLYEANRRTNTYAPEEWKSLSVLFIQYPDFRAHFTRHFIPPLNELCDPKTINPKGADPLTGFGKSADSILVVGRVYYETAAFVSSLRSKPQAEQVEALGKYFKDYPFEETSSIRIFAFIDCGKDLLPAVLNTKDNAYGALTDGIAKLMVENETETFDVTSAGHPDEKLMEHLKDRAPATLDLIQIALSGHSEEVRKKAEEILTAQPLAIYLMMVLASGKLSKRVLSKLISLIIKALSSDLAPATDLMYKLLLAYVINMSGPGKKSLLAIPGIKNAIVAYFSRTARFALNQMANGILLESEKRLFRVENGNGRVPKSLHDANETAALTEAFYVEAIKMDLLNVGIEGERGVSSALTAARAFAAFVAGESDASPDIAYIPGFIAARLSAENREKSVDEIKKAISADRGRNGIFVAMDIVQNILGPEIYTALGQAYKELNRPEHFVEALLYSHILVGTSRMDKVKTVLNALKAETKAWVTLLALINHDRFAEARQMIGVILDHARTLAGAENPYSAENLKKAIDSADRSINAIFTNTFDQS